MNITINNLIITVKTFIMSKLKGKSDEEKNEFYMELASWAQAQTNGVIESEGAERTKYIKAFFRGIKKSIDKL